MARNQLIAILGTCAVLLAGAVSTAAQGPQSYLGLFDVAARKAFLAQDSAADARQACLAVEADPAWGHLEVIKGLSSTQGYGTDRSGAAYAWATMVLSGRALAGDRNAEASLKALLLKWADAGAFAQTEQVHDAYYALKRLLLPTVVAFSIIRDDLTADESKRVEAWIDPLVRRIDQTFDGDVDLNNHRYLADSVLMTWGSMIGDEALYRKGMDRFHTILSDARGDGSLPLETRRGSRSLWYMRQSLSSMTVMAEVAAGHGDDLLRETVGDTGDRRSFATILSFWINGLTNPIMVNAYAAENYIPGPEEDFMKTDFGFLQNRGNGRHYLAFLEALAVRQPDSYALRRSAALLAREGSDERPLIDEFIGGNATCFWSRS